MIAEINQESGKPHCFKTLYFSTSSFSIVSQQLSTHKRSKKPRPCRNDGPVHSLYLKHLLNSRQFKNFKPSWAEKTFENKSASYLELFPLRLILWHIKVLISIGFAWCGLQGWLRETKTHTLYKACQKSLRRMKK